MNQFANTLEDTIIRRGAPNRLLSDRGQAINSHKVEDILNMFCINKWQSEPHQHHQNPAERQYDDNSSLRMPLTVFLIVLVHQHTYGYSAYSMFATY
jgi:hypothetical protein